MAEELIKLYAARQAAPGYAFSADTPWQRDFEDDFPYEETPDQLQCIEEIKQDMQQPHPMDRLLCGDVGYGKTEVAVRAAFKAVMDSKQVAFLVPTTVLAQQHYQSVKKRFAHFPVRIEMLSRFRTAQEQKHILQQLKEGKIDILINNAGITNDSTLKKMTVEQWQNVIDVNLSGTFYCCKAVLNYMLEAGYGRIVNASSVVGLYGNFGQTNYVATKAGLIGMTKTMARELGRKGITVNAVAPGFIETEMVAKMPENVLDGMRAKVPVGRLGRPEEIAAAYLYLASDEAAYVNGAVLSVDGGMTV